MEIVLTIHARRRMLERGILLTDIEMALLNPDIVEQLEQNRFKAVKSIKMKIIKVIYTVEHDRLIVITVA